MAEWSLSNSSLCPNCQWGLYYSPARKGYVWKCKHCGKFRGFSMDKPQVFDCMHTHFIAKGILSSKRTYMNVRCPICLYSYFIYDYPEGTKR